MLCTGLEGKSLVFQATSFLQWEADPPKNRCCLIIRCIELIWIVFLENLPKSIVIAKTENTVDAAVVKDEQNH